VLGRWPCWECWGLPANFTPSASDGGPDGGTGFPNPVHAWLPIAYEVKARWREGGRTLTRSRRATFAAGEEVTVTFLSRAALAPR
jgi:hypothetical protein